MKYFLRHITRLSLLPALLLAIGALALWIPDYLHMPQRWFDLMLTQILLAFNAVFLSVLLYQGKASRSYTALPVPLMIIVVAALPHMRCEWLLQLWISVILLFLFWMQQVEDNQSPDGGVFFVSLALCVLSLWIPDALWCIIYLWLVVLMRGAFSLRTILASAIALAVFVFYYAIARYFGWMVEWAWASLLSRAWFVPGATLPDILSITVILVGTFPILFAAFRRSLYGFVSTRMLIYHCALLYLIVTPLILFDRPDGCIHSMLAIATPAITSIFLLQKESESRGITFLLYIVVALALYASSFVC